MILVPLALLMIFSLSLLLFLASNLTSKINLGPLSYFLGLQITHDSIRLHISHFNLSMVMILFKNSTCSRANLLLRHLTLKFPSPILVGLSWLLLHCNASWLAHSPWYFFCCQYCCTVYELTLHYSYNCRQTDSPLCRMYNGLMDFGIILFPHLLLLRICLLRC